MIPGILKLTKYTCLTIKVVKGSSKIIYINLFSRGYKVITFLLLGLYLYNDILAVLSVQHQTIHIFQILDGMFINVRTIGRFCLEDDAYLISGVWSGVNSRPFRDTTINSLKHKLLVYLYKRAAYVSASTKNPYELRRFYQYFDQVIIIISIT